MNKTIEKSVAVNETSVSRLAYQLWENAGRPAGRDLEFWLAAEAKVKAWVEEKKTMTHDKISEWKEQGDAKRLGVRADLAEHYAGNCDGNCCRCGRRG